MNEITLFSPAKLNLFLHITGQREDDYHHLQSVFRAINFGDTLTVRKSSSSKLVTLIGAEGLTANIHDNLIVKAVYVLANKFPAYQTSVQIILDKHIPTGAGLGGGSSNCAMTLIAINELWGLHLGVNELIDIATTLGADVPFFVFSYMHQTDAVAQGIGEQLSAIELPKRDYLLLLPDTHASTQALFNEPTLNKNLAVIADVASHQEKFLDKLIIPFCNVFEPVATNDSQIAQALAYLRQLQPKTQTTARMTGTGCAVFLPIIYALSETDSHAFVHQAPCQAMIVESLYG